jgi:N-acetylglucosaminyldiphosphoundecaprenol N-acetyl-beta-D-mannosaminyltransferase
MPNEGRPDPASPPVVEVMGFPLWAVDTSGLIALLTDRANRGVRSTVCYLNAHSWNLARRDPEFGRLLGSADVLYADGMSFVWASRLLGSPLPCRLSSADYVDQFALACAARHVDLFLLGGREGVAHQAGVRLEQIAPGLRVVGSAGGHFDSSENAALTEAINRARPHILLVGMGSPRQERWAVANRERLAVPVIWTVGALFDYLANVEIRAPQWLCKIGFEWLFRLAMDPKGKAGRYLFGNPAFAGAVVMAKLRQGLGRRCGCAKRTQAE